MYVCMKNYMLKFNFLLLLLVLVDGVSKQETTKVCMYVCNYVRMVQSRCKFILAREQNIYCIQGKSSTHNNGSLRAFTHEWLAFSLFNLISTIALAIQHK